MNLTASLICYIKKEKTMQIERLHGFFIRNKGMGEIFFTIKQRGISLFVIHFTINNITDNPFMFQQYV